MDFEVTYTEEQQRFREEVRAWFEANVPPGITRTPSSPEESYANYQQRRELGRKLGAKGWLFPMAPKEYGGGSLDVDHAIILEEEADRFDLSLPPFYDTGGTLGAPTILVWGTEEQKKTFLPPIHRGEVRVWQLLSEPSAGSDLAGVKMRAIRDGDEYVLNGQKIFIGSANGTDWMWTIAVTDPNGERHKNVSWFMIDASLPGITVQPMDGDTGQARVDHEPAHVFMALAVGVGNRDSPHPVSAVSAADENLLAVKDVFVAVADRAHFYSGEVGAGARLR